jgi:hypothetical protein
MTDKAICELCGEPMPDGEEMFKFHGYSGECPKPPLPKPKLGVKVAVAIDAWKLPIFVRHLLGAGYAFDEGSGLTADTLHLYIVTDDLARLDGVVRAANNEAARSKMT